jgi:D-alanyl-D-alanine carboxypeptidase
MITPKDCIDKYGSPTDPHFEPKWMTLFIPDMDIHEAIAPLPAKIYMNKDLVEPFKKALQAIYDGNFEDQLQEWGGCFCIRMMRGVKPPTPSIHSWGIAVDINETIYPQGKKLDFVPDYAQCFIDNGFDWGNDFPIPDPMHFQLKNI